MTTTDDEMLKPAQAAKLLNVSPRTLQYWRSMSATGKPYGPPFHKLENRTVRYKRSDIDEYRNSKSSKHHL